MAQNNLSELLEKAKEEMASEHAGFVKAVEQDIGSFRKSMLSRA